MEKTTKKQMFEALVNLANGGHLAYENEDGEMVVVTNDALLAFAENELEQLDKKAAKAKERAAAKKAEVDVLLDAVKEVLTDEFETRDAIAEKIDMEDATVAKVGARLTKLVNEGFAVKEDITIEGADGKKKKVKGYKVV
jgi:hypothetical protein